MAGPTELATGFIVINKGSPAAPNNFPHPRQVPPKLIMQQQLPPPHHYPPNVPPNMQLQYPFPKPQRMEIDDDNDSNATVSEKEEGHYDYTPNRETINLAPYYASLGFLLSPPTGMPYATSIEVATLLMNTSLQVQPLHDQSNIRSEHAFMERLFNFGGMLGKCGHVPLFSSSTGEYKFHTIRDRDIAAQHGFASEEQMLKYLDDLKGTGRNPSSDGPRFQTPWHDIDLVFEPRKRGNVEPRNTNTRRSKSGAARPKKAVDPDPADKDEPASSPSADPDPDTLMTNGDDASLASPATPHAAPATSAPAAAKPKKKYQLPKKIPVEPVTHPICAEDLIHAVTRHPLLLPARPVTTAFIIAHAPHLLQNVGLLYVLAHGELENEGLSERLGRLGLDVAPNVLAHRKKKALVDLGGDYKERKAQYESYKKSLKRGKAGR